MTKIFVAEVNQAFWIRVEGSASLRDAPQFKKCLQQAFESEHKELVVDLEVCRSMDSSFMGTLTAFALKLEDEDCQTTLEIINVGTRCLNALEELGIDQILVIDRDDNTHLDERALVSRALSEIEVETEKPDKEILANQSLIAHKALQKANSDNILRFQDVVDYLEKETSSSENSPE